MRIGDDTSGKNFNRTRKMGVNSLAFRMPQHNTFYLCDADCVGITDAIAWQDNKMWLRLIAMSGTPLFISCDAMQLNDEQRSDIQRSINQALNHQYDIRPQHWESSRYPEEWASTTEYALFDWYRVPRTLPLLN